MPVVIYHVETVDPERSKNATEERHNAFTDSTAEWGKEKLCSPHDFDLSTINFIVSDDSKLKRSVVGFNPPCKHTFQTVASPLRNALYCKDCQMCNMGKLLNEKIKHAEIQHLFGGTIWRHFNGDIINVSLFKSCIGLVKLRRGWHFYRLDSVLINAGVKAIALQMSRICWVLVSCLLNDTFNTKNFDSFY